MTTSSPRCRPERLSCPAAEQAGKKERPSRPGGPEPLCLSAPDERAEAGEESPRQRQVDDDPGQQTGIALLKDAPSLEKVSQRHDQQQPAGFDE